MASPAENKTGASREGLTEYLIVVALLVLMAIGALAIFGREIREFFGITRSAPTAEVEPHADDPQ
jgi:hypothetical protein